MNLIYLTPKVLPPGRSRYACYDPDTNRYGFGSELAKLRANVTADHLSPTNWNLVYSNFHEFVNHPDIFRSDTHPELFL